jgi:hypothetical protein
MASEVYLVEMFTKSLIGVVAATGLALATPLAAHADPQFPGRLITADCGSAGTYTLQTTPNDSAVALVKGSNKTAVLVGLNGTIFIKGIPQSKLTTCTLTESNGNVFGVGTILFTPQGGPGSG